MESEHSILTTRPRERARGALALVDRLIPQALHGDADMLRRARLLVVINAMLVASALFFANESTDWLSRGILLAGAFIALLNLPLLWWSRSVGLPATLCTVELILVILSNMWIGVGVGDAPQWFLMIAPMLGTFLVGPRFGVTTAIVCIGIVVVLFALEQNGVHFNAPAPSDKWFHATGATLVLALVTAFATMYESARQRNAELVEAAMRELRGKNEELQRLATEFQGARDRAVDESKRKSEFLEQMRAFAEQQGMSLENTRRATAQLSDTIRAIAASVETLATSSTASDATIAGMASSATRVTQTVGTLVENVQETGKAISVLTSAVSALQGQYDDLRRGAQTTASSMLAMEESAARVEANAARTVQLSDAMIKDAERGQDAVRRTLAGVDEIRASARVVGDVIRTLEQRVGAIGAINNVIEEVAVETNVLALNASIIAAQAGERGSGFAVVADQIKALAARTAGSTREITAVIRALQAETQNAVGAIADGDRAVESGVSLSDEAARVLEQIVASAKQATEEVRGIEQATMAQAKRAREVGLAMGEVTRLVAAAVKATTDGGNAVALIDAAMKKLSAIAPELADRSNAQSEGGKLARAAIARISDMAKRLSSVQADQSRASDETLRAIEELQKTQRGQEEALRRLSG